MPTKTPAPAKQPPSFASRWERAFAKEEQPFETLPYAAAVQALAAGDMPATLALCQKHPELLAQGAAHGSSLLNASLARANKAPLSIALIARGAWAGRAPVESGRHCSPAPASDAPFEGALADLWRAIAIAAPDSLFLDAASAALACSGRPFPSPDEWVRLALRCSKIELALQMHDAHALGPDPETGSLVDALIRGGDQDYGLNKSHPILAAMRGGSEEDRGGAWRLIALLKDSLSPEAVQRLWSGAIGGGSARHVDRLARLELLPPGWLLPAGWNGQPYTGACSALVAAALSSSRAIFHCLREIPEAVEAARAFAHQPRQFVDCPPSEIATLARLGVDVGVVDNDGHSFLHLWARKDQEPRDGWRTVCKALPDLLDKPDNLGRAPRAMQLARLSGRHRANFEATLASIDRAALAKEIAPAQPTEASRKPRL